MYGPPETVPRYTKYPTTVDVLAVQFMVTEWGIGTNPVPVAETTVGELDAVLTTVMVPFRLTAAVGANTALKLAVWLGDNVTGSVIPVSLSAVPEAVIWETVKFTLPELVSVTGRVLLLPAATLPKATGFGLADSCVTCATPMPFNGIVVVGEFEA